VVEIAAKTFAAIDRVALANTEQRHGDILPRAVDRVVHRPCDEASAGHRRGGLRKDPVRLEAGNERLRAQHIGDKAGGDLWHVLGAGGRQRERAERAGGGENEKQFFAGHGFLRHVRASHQPELLCGRSPDLEIDLTEICSGSPIPKIAINYNDLIIIPRER
jgi:hypothetical protein